MTTEMMNGGLKTSVSSFFGSFFIALLITNYSYYDDDYNDGGAAGDGKQGLMHLMNGLQWWDNDHDNATMETNEERGTSKRGPNDTRHVVWAIGTCFFFLYSCYFILTNIYSFYLHFEGMRMASVDNKNENGPKRCIWTHHLGHKYVFSLFVLCFMHTN